MKKNLSNIKLAVVVSSSLFLLGACRNENMQTQQAAVKDLSETINLGGELKTNDESANLIAAYRKQATKIGEAYLAYEMFDKSVINEILKQPDCQGIKVWLGYDVKTQQKKLILVGVDRNGNNIVKNASGNYKLVAVRGTDKDSKLKTFAESVSLITAHKTHANQTGEDYLAYEMFDKNLIEEVLNQANCQSLKISIGYDTRIQRKKILLMGTDSNGNKIKNLLGNYSLVDDGIKCPTPAYCD